MTTLPEKQSLSAHVRGRVQGVGYRHFVWKQAAGRGLRGWVRNEPDGSVRLVAEGSREALESFLEAVRRGPVAARVTDVQVHWGPAAGHFEDFEVRFF